jgi:hypothetical protein
MRASSTSLRRMWGAAQIRAREESEPTSGPRSSFGHKRRSRAQNPGNRAGNERHSASEKEVVEALRTRMVTPKREADPEPGACLPSWW